MKLIERKQYLDKMIGVIGTPDIKVLTGVRRSGKSKLLEAFKSYVQENIPNANIIHINFNLSKYDNLKEYEALNEHIESNYAEDKENFVLIDEIQMCNGFELCINNLHATEKYDIYITGSNAFLLSSDLATLFTGRTFEIKVYPFSFAEYVQYFSLSDKYTAFDRYMLEGGMSGSYLYKEQEDKFDYIENVFDTLILRDIRQKYNIKNPALMDRISQFLMDNVSNLTSARSITDTLASNKDKINHKTVGNYLQYLCNAFVAYFKEYVKDLKDKYDKVYLVRNERQLAIYSFDGGERFEPDYLLFLHLPKQDGYEQLQIFIEPKGTHLVEKDSWKEDFLLQIESKAIPVTKFADDNKYKIWGFHFFNRDVRTVEFDSDMKKL